MEGLIGEFLDSLDHSIIITIFVFSMMIIVDYINILTQGKLKDILSKSKGKQYIISSFLGSTPGCLGAFMSVSMYVHGVITFGALTACMIATSGDEAFVMLILFPRDAIVLFLLLFIIGILSGIVVDRIFRRIGIEVCRECVLQEYHEKKTEKMFSRKPTFFKARIVLITIFLSLIIMNVLGLFGPKEIGSEKIIFLSILLLMVFISIFSSDHYLREHIIHHIARNHIWRVFLWTLGALIFINILISLFNLDTFIQSNMNLVLILSALIGIIPESGPHMIFVMMYSRGLIPFSVLLTSSIVQDGHGMLPLLSYTVKDSLMMKSINLAVGLITGFIFYYLGF